MIIFSSIIFSTGNIALSPTTPSRGKALSDLLHSVQEKVKHHILTHVYAIYISTENPTDTAAKETQT